MLISLVALECVAPVYADAAGPRGEGAAGHHAEIALDVDGAGLDALRAVRGADRGERAADHIGEGVARAVVARLLDLERDAGAGEGERLDEDHRAERAGR